MVYSEGDGDGGGGEGDVIGGGWRAWREGKRLRCWWEGLTVGKDRIRGGCCRDIRRGEQVWQLVWG